VTVYGQRKQPPDDDDDDDEDNDNRKVCVCVLRRGTSVGQCPCSWVL